MPSSGFRVRRGCQCQLRTESQLDVIGEAEIQDVSQTEFREKTKGQGQTPRTVSVKTFTKVLDSTKAGIPTPNWVYMGLVWNKQGVGIGSGRFPRPQAELHARTA